MKTLIVFVLFVCGVAQAKIRQPCPDDAKYWCDDGSCVSNYLDCLEPCPEPVAFLCSDGSCVEHEEECSEYRDECSVEKSAKNQGCEELNNTINAGFNLGLPTLKSTH